MSESCRKSTIYFYCFYVQPINSGTKNLCFMPVDPGGDNHIAKLNAFSQHKKLDKLKCIDIDFTHIIEDYHKQDKEIAEILNRILMASAESVEEIILRTPIGYLPGVIFPVMKKVIKLQLLFYWYGTDTTDFNGYLRRGQIFPKGFKFTVLPKLADVIINLETEGGNPQNYSRFDCWQNNLKSCRIAKSVKNIEYSDDCGFSIKRLKTSFPNAIWSESSTLNSTYKSTSEDDSEDDSEDGYRGWL